MKLFIARRNKTTQDFFVEAARAFIKDNATTEERKYWPDDSWNNANNA